MLVLPQDLENGFSKNAPEPYLDQLLDQFSVIVFSLDLKDSALWASKV